MIPLLFAAALALSPAAAPPSSAPAVADLTRPTLRMPSFRILEPPSALDCAARFATLTAGPDGARLRKLGDLPPGVLEHAVLRSIGGCPVREVVEHGQIRYLAGADPQLEGVDPVARRSGRR